MSKFKLPESIGTITHFVWGPVVHVHEVGHFHIIEYNPEIFSGCSGTGKYDKTLTKFSIVVDGEDCSVSTDTLEEALVYAIAIWKLGRFTNDQAAYYACKILNLEQQNA